MIELIAQNFSMNFYTCTAAYLLQYTTDVDKLMADFYKKIQRTGRPLLFFIDEFDKIRSDKSDEQGKQRRLLTALGKTGHPCAKYVFFIMAGVYANWSENKTNTIFRDLPYDEDGYPKDIRGRITHIYELNPMSDESFKQIIGS